MRVKKKIGKRILALGLSAVMLLSPLPLSGNVSYAEELASPAQEALTEEQTVGGETGQPETQPPEGGETGQPETQPPEGGETGQPETQPPEGGETGRPETQPPEGEGAGQSGTGEENPDESGDAQENDPAQQQPPLEEETPPDQETEAPADQEEDENDESVSANTVQISGNSLLSVEDQEIWVQAEIEGAYQFGSAPSAEETGAFYAASVDAQSAYTDEQIMDDLYQQMKARVTPIDVSQYGIPYETTKPTKIGSLVSGVLNEHPDLYYVSGNFQYSHDNTTIQSLLISYDNTMDDAGWQQGVNAALASVASGMNDLQKAIALHDYLTVNCEYDKENLDKGAVPSVSHSAYGALVNRTAVCDGYALAYKYLLKQEGINCYMVTSDEINHAWNLIELNGQYYQVDVTWDDPTWDRIGRSVHSYMFRSDANFDPANAGQKHSGGRVTYGSQTVDYRATDNRYDNAFWTDCESPLVLSGSDCYYISPDGGDSGKPALMRTNLTDVTADGTALQSIDKWTVWLNANMAWPGAYSGLFRMGNRLYYNDKANIYSVAMDGTDRKTVFTADTTYGYIYGSAYCRGAVRYSLHQDPNLTQKEDVLKANISEDGLTPQPLPESGVALDLDNPYGSYTAIDGTTITSAANGKPKLLIFYGNDCGNCQATILSISEAISAFSGADIYALEVKQGTKEAAAQMQKKWGCEEILFSYDTSTKNKNSMMAYLREAGITDTAFNMPVLCYIDGNNRFQYITRGVQTGEQARSNLEKYCGFQRAYKITYVLRGGTNHQDNPTSYTEKDEVITLKDPVREGYRFEGWYSNIAYTSPKVTEIYGENKSDITLFAKWKSLSDTETPAMIDLTPAEGNVLMGFSGTYYTETADKILKRLNAIRLEACKQGVPRPGTKVPLTEADYVPLQWSSDLEAIARLRAAEATVSQGHTRPNGERCFTVVTQNGEQSWAENLAWNYDGLMKGIEQWYGEKNDWVNQKAGKVTGHYTSIINPNYKTVGVGAFRLSSGGWYAVAQEFSHNDNMDSHKDTGAGKCVQYLEVQGKNVTNLAFTGARTTFLQEGDSCRFSVNVTAQYKDYYKQNKNFTGPYREGGTWTSSNEKAAAVDPTGEVIAVGKGEAQIKLSAGAKFLAQKITVYGQGESPITVKAPNITTYKVGQKINFRGGKVTYPSGSTVKSAALAANMISGFDSSKPGLCTVKVTAGGYASSFETLIVEEPKLTVMAGHSLAEIALPSNAYGTYSWQDNTQTVEKAGVYTFTADFIPNDEVKFQKLSDIKVQVTAQETLGNDTDVTFKTNRFTYNGEEQEPKPVVRSSDVVLKEGTDYELSYVNNRNAGEATVTIKGIGCYLGSITKTFVIEPVKLVVAAQDKTILIGDPLPQAGDYAYEVSGLLAEDAMITEPVFSCGITDTKTAGRYEIIPSGAGAGLNYEIPAANYKSGILTVAEEAVSCTVTFDAQGHGTAPARQIGLRVGSLAEKPADPTETGYRFDGWYREAACTKAWNFDTDIVQTDISLYAKWMRVGADGGFALREIGDVYYTGNACKPAVSVYDGDTLLKAGRDYQVKYYNHKNANKDGVLKTGNGEGADFNPELPYVEIIGKGNYTDRVSDGNKNTVKVNFNILPAVIGDGSDVPAKGVALKVTDQLVTAKKVQKPFSSVKYVKAMKRDVDFSVSLTVVNARDGNGKSLNHGLELEKAELPKEYAGEFLLTVAGKGNYTGSIQKTIYVTDKAHLMKNATITIGKNIRNVEFSGKTVRLPVAEAASDDAVTVKYGKTFLKPGRDYTVSCRNNDKVGKAELTVTGNGEYVGTKTATFQIKGKAFSAKTVRVEGLTELEYTGKALTQNGVKLTWYAKNKPDVPLEYGKHYTISYAKNCNKGTATMTFKGVEKNGYSGSFKKTFKITAVDIADTTKVTRADTMENMNFPYCKAGVKPVDEIRLTNGEGIVLQNGKDYTLKYANNRAAADASAQKPPTVTVQGKGNYSGKFSIVFRIEKCGLKQAVDDGSVQAAAAMTTYNPKKAETYVYKPAVKLLDGKSALRANKEYEMQYLCNTQRDVSAYLQAYEQACTDGKNPEETLRDMMPRAVIWAKDGSNYKNDGQIVVPLPIYQTKLTAKNLEITVAEMVYVGNQVTSDKQPAVTVKLKGTEDVILIPEKDYTVSYGANNKSGKNTGSVTIKGLAPRYGGSVTKKFNIVRKPISY